MNKFAAELSIFPTLRKAWDLMLVDNVASHQMIEDARKQVDAGRVFELPHPPAPAEAELHAMSEDELDVLCTGDESEWPKVSEETAAVLTSIFEDLL